MARGNLESFWGVRDALRNTEAGEGKVVWEQIIAMRMWGVRGGELPADRKNTGLRKGS